VSSPTLVWTQEERAGVPLAEFVGHAGAIEAGRVMYDGSNKFWVWSSALADDAWGYGTTRESAQAGFEAWLRTWLGIFRAFLGNAAG